MKRPIRLLLTGAMLACTLSLVAGGYGKRITYSVDSATTFPPATVIQHGQGVSVVVFRVADLDAGGTFTFLASLDVKGHNVLYPTYATFTAMGQSGLTVTFDPAAVTVPATVPPQATLVTVTLAPGNYSRHHLKATIKAEPASGHGLGRGPGIKVVITDGAWSPAATPEEQILQDVTDGLTPGPGTN